VARRPNVIEAGLQDTPLIARTWHGRVPAEKADEYYAYLLRTGLAEYASTPGNRGVTVLRRTDNGVTHFLLITVWESIDAIKAFAGEDYERARYFSEDDEYLLEREPFVTHYEVLTAPGPSAI
jgi:heme-degrading monooxygenase HmoA